MNLEEAKRKIQTYLQLNQKLRSRLQSQQKHYQKQVEQLRVSYVNNIQDIRMGYSSTIQTYITKLNLYEQETTLLRNQLHAEQQQAKNKEQQIRTMKRTIELLSSSECKQEKYTNIMHNKSQQINQQPPSEQRSSYSQDFSSNLIEKLVKNDRKINEYKQEIQEIRKQASSLRIELFSYKTKNEQMKNEKDSLHTQNQYYKEQYELSIKQRQHLKHTIKELQTDFNQNLQLQNSKEKYINQQMKVGIAREQRKVKQLEERLVVYVSQIQMLKENNEQLYNREKQVSGEVEWYRQLLDEAKSNFVQSQLMKQQAMEKLKQENSLVKKQLKKTKNINTRKKQSKQNQSLSSRCTEHAEPTMSYKKWKGKNKNSLNSTRIANSYTSVYDEDNQKQNRNANIQSKNNFANNLKREGKNVGSTSTILDKCKDVNLNVNQISLQEIRVGQQHQKSSQINYLSHTNNNCKGSIRNSNYSKAESSIISQYEKEEDNQQQQNCCWLEYKEQGRENINSLSNYNNDELFNFSKKEQIQPVTTLKSKQHKRRCVEKGKSGAKQIFIRPLTEVQVIDNSQDYAEMPSIGNVEKFLNSERSKQSKLSIFLKKSDCNQKKKKPVINSNQSSKYHEVGQASRGNSFVRQI